VTVAKSSGALHGRRVLDLADASGAYCGKLLADLGADVIKVEPPDGDPSRRHPPFRARVAHPDASLFFLYMNTSKRGVVLDLAEARDRERLLELARGSDLLIEAFPPGQLDALGLGYAALCRANPRLVLTSITGFGQTGPRRGWKSSDLVATALGGAAGVIGEAEDPPVRLAGEQAHVSASLVAAASSLIALHQRDRTGQGRHVDVSIQEAVLSLSHITGVGKYLDDGIVPRRRGAGLFASVPSGTYRCRDGLVYLMINRPAHWQALARWVHEVTGNEEVLAPIFDGPSSNRIEYRELLDLFIAELTERFTVQEVYREGQRRHIAFTPVNGAAALIEDPQLEARGFFAELAHPVAGAMRMPGAPYRLSRTPWRMTRPAPRPGEHQTEILGGEPPLRARTYAAAAESGAELEGLRVLEFSSAMAGPWIGRFMAHCGAEVIRVESRKRPDVVRLYVPPRAPELGTQPQLSPWFTDWNAGKRFVALDLANPLGAELARRLAAACGVVIENQRAGVMEKLGLGYRELARARPDLVMLSSSGFGDTGPCRSYVTWGPNIEALSGLAELSGFAGRSCTMTQYAYPDGLSALHGLVALMAALDHRARTGEGQHIDLSQLEATVASIGHALLEQLADGVTPARRGNRSTWAAPHDCYPCRGEDRWCAIAVTSDAEWAALCRAIGRPDWAADSRLAHAAGRLAHADELDAGISAWTRERDDIQVMDLLQRAGVPAGAVQDTRDQHERDPHLAARGFFEELEHYKKGRVTATGIPLGLGPRTRPRLPAGAALGQDNTYVFREILGLSADEFREHVEAGAIEMSDAE